MDLLLDYTTSSSDDSSPSAADTTLLPPSTKKKRKTSPAQVPLRHEEVRRPILTEHTRKIVPSNVPRDVPFPSSNPLTNSLPANEPVIGAYVSKRRKHVSSIPAISADSNHPTFKLPEVDAYLTAHEYPDAAVGVASSTTNRISARLQYKWVGHNGRPIEGLDWHPTHSNILLTCGFNGTCNLWNTLKPNHCLMSYSPHASQAVSSVAWLSPTCALTGGYDNRAVLTDYITMKETAIFKHEGHVTALKPHPCDNNLFVSGDASKNVHLWDTRVEKPVTKYIGGGGRVLDVELINNGMELVASCDIVRKNAGSKMLLVWDVSSGILRSNQIYNEPYTCPCLRASPTERTFLAQSNADYIIIFSTDRPYKLNKFKRFEGHLVNGYRTLFDISPDGSLVCSGSANGKLYFYHYHSTKIIKTIEVGGDSPVIAVKWHPTYSSMLACSTWDGTVAICQ